jgi:hypothetical protein
MNIINRPLAESRKHFADRYVAMNIERQAVALARLGNLLSLMARETYAVGGGVSDGERLRTFNEAQNKVLAQLERLLTSDPQRYPDDVFTNILCDQFEMLGVDTQTLLVAAGILQSQASGNGITQPPPLTPGRHS